MVEDVLSLATLKGGNPAVFLEAAQLMNEHGAGALDSLHAAFCGQDNRLISSDKVFDRLGLKRIPLQGSRNILVPAWSGMERGDERFWGVRTRRRTAFNPGSSGRPGYLVHPRQRWKAAKSSYRLSIGSRRARTRGVIARQATPPSSITLNPIRSPRSCIGFM